MNKMAEDYDWDDFICEILGLLTKIIEKEFVWDA